MFTAEQVLQETIIIKMKKTKTAPDNVIITSSQSNRDFNDVSFSGVITYTVHTHMDGDNCCLS